MTTNLWARPGSFPPPPPSLPPPPPPTTPAGRPPSRSWVAPDRRVLLVLVSVGLVVDVTWRSRLDAVAGTVFVLALVGALVAGGRLRNPQAAALTVAAVPFAVLLACRTSAWVVGADAVVAGGLVLLAASYSRGGSVVAATGSGFVVRAGRLGLSVALAPAYLFAAVAGAMPVRSEARRERWRAVGRGLGLAVPLVVVLGLLLASADAVFGSLLHVPIDLSSVLPHTLLVAAGLCIGSFLLLEASSEPLADLAIEGRPLGSTEAAVVLTGIVVLFGFFAAVQVVVAARGEAYVRETAGVTYAEHARQGFFQLLAVAGLTFVLLASLRVLTRRDTRRERLRFVILTESVVALTLVIVGVAVARLGLYEQAYGLTMLRYASTATAWWLGAAFVILGIALAGPVRARPWLTSAVLSSAVVAVGLFSLVNPEAVVARRNAALFTERGRLDLAYLAELSDDAVPTLVETLPQLPPEARAGVLAFVCGPRRAMSVPSGLDTNISEVRAARTRARVCPS